jgi:hypothetical protein
VVAVAALVVAGLLTAGRQAPAPTPASAAAPPPVDNVAQDRQTAQGAVQPPDRHRIPDRGPPPDLPASAAQASDLDLTQVVWRCATA